MSTESDDHAMLSRLVGTWEGTFRHRVASDQPFQEFPGRSENRWVLGGRFVEMTLRGVLSADGWSALFYIGYERSERRYVLVSLEPGDLRITIRRGEWDPGPGRLVLVSTSKNGATDQHQRSRIVCDFQNPGALTLELAEESPTGEEFVRFKANYHSAAQATAHAPIDRPFRRSVIA
jgi:hypothetical protein